MNFLKDEMGAVTVDWTVLTAMAVACGMAVLALVGPALSSRSSDVNTELGADKIVQTASNVNEEYIPNSWDTFQLWRESAGTWPNGDIISAMADMGGNNKTSFMETATFDEQDKYAGLQSALIANGGARPTGWADAVEF